MKRKPTIVGPDGISRPWEKEDELNADMANLFANPLGTKMLDYLKSITIHSVAGPEQSDSALRHLEGGRYIVGLITARLEMGINKRKGIMNE